VHSVWQLGGVDGAVVCVVQHGEKYPLRGNPGLSELGREHAAATAAFLAERRWDALYSSPLRRARETADTIGRCCGLVPKPDERLRERMNWGGGPIVQHLSAFLADWEHATHDRSWEPPSGDSSEATGARMHAAIDDYVAGDEGAILVVSHGGATTDLLRTLFGDERLRLEAPTILADGIGSCGLTWLDYAHHAWHLTRAADRRHLGS
jgi:broad specificity phosphatase PhoE